MAEFGDRVCVTAVLDRRYVSTGPRGYDRKEWRRREIAPREGLLIGWRTLSDGNVWWEDEVGRVFAPTHHFRAALVVFSPRSAPVHVPLDDLQETATAHPEGPSG